MGGEPCSEHGIMCGKIGSMEAMMHSIKESVDKAVERIDHHILEADKPGGVRDRVGLLEASIRVQQESISVIKQGYWKACIVSAVIGGLLARLAPETLWVLVNKFIRMWS